MIPARTHTSRAGYTIMEIGIVVMIIGLLIGAVFIGRSMIRDAELRGYLMDVDRFEKGLKLFYDKYNAMPGDMFNATDNWGTDPGGCPNTAWDNMLKRETCNGNGDGRIAMRNADAGTNTALYESFRAWQQMADAGFMDSSFAGMAGTSGSDLDARVGVNVPASGISQVGYMIYYLQCDSCAANYFPANYKHVIQTGRKGVFPEDSTSGPFLSPGEAHNLDAKVDDGLPAAGKILIPTTQVDCLTDTGPDTARYAPETSTSFACAPLFITGM